MMNTEMENGTQMTLEQYMPEIFQEQIYGVLEHHAKTSQLPDTEQDWKVTEAPSLERYLESSGKSQKKIDPNGLSTKMLRECLAVTEDGIISQYSWKWMRGGYDIEWQIFNSKYYGVPQNRERVYTIGHLRTKGQRSVLPIEGADREDSIQINQIGMQPNANRQNSNCNRVYDPEGLGPCINTMEGGGLEPCVPVPVDCFDVGYIGFGRVGVMTEETPTICAWDYKDPLRVGIPIQFGIDKSTVSGEIEQANTLTAREDRGVSVQRQTGNAIAIPVLTPDRTEKRQNGRRFKENEDDMFTLTTQDRHGVAVSIPIREAVQRGYTEAFEGDSINYSFIDSKLRRGRVGHQVANTLDCKCEQAVIEKIEGDPPEHPGCYVQIEDGSYVYAVWYEKYQCYIAIRKLTPRECFRLQGWSDEYFERAEFVNSNSQLYKQAGNGVTVNVVYEIVKRL